MEIVFEAMMLSIAGRLPCPPATKKLVMKIINHDK